MGNDERIAPRDCAYYSKGHNVFYMVAIKDAARERVEVKVEHLKGAAFAVTYKGETEIWFTHDPDGFNAIKHHHKFLAEGTTRIYVGPYGYSPFHFSREPLTPCKRKKHLIDK